MESEPEQKPQLKFHEAVDLGKGNFPLAFLLLVLKVGHDVLSKKYDHARLESELCSDSTVEEYALLYANLFIDKIRWVPGLAENFIDIVNTKIKIMCNNLDSLSRKGSQTTPYHKDNLFELFELNTENGIKELPRFSVLPSTFRLTNIQAVYFWKKIQNRLENYNNRAIVDITTDTIESNFDFQRVDEFYDEFLEHFKLTFNAILERVTVDNLDFIQDTISNCKKALTEIHKTIYYLKSSSDGSDTLDPFKYLTKFLDLTGPREPFNTLQNKKRSTNIFISQIQRGNY